MPSRSYSCGAGTLPLLGCCIGEMLDRSTALHPDRDALIVRHQNRRYTYRQLCDEVELAARGLLRLGVRKGDRVGIWSTNCAEWVVLQFAAAKAGAILVNINPANRAFELEYVLRQSECQTLVLVRASAIAIMFKRCAPSQPISSAARAILCAQKNFRI